ncbi:hypothetical protein ACA910_012046 [Epithemia clementina (nom. ined.)]
MPSSAEESCTIPGIRFVDYVDESQLDAVMDLVGRDLSEPYSIFTYRYFLYRFPQLCILAVAEDSDTPIGCVVGKMDRENFQRPDEDDDEEDEQDAGDNNSKNNDNIHNTNNNNNNENEYEDETGGDSILKEQVSLEDEFHRKVHLGANSEEGTKETISAFPKNDKSNNFKTNENNANNTDDECDASGRNNPHNNNNGSGEGNGGGDWTGYIGMLAVRESYRRRGIGKALVRLVLQRMKQFQCTSATLETEVTNTTAQTLYQECFGFIREELLVRYYLNWNDAYRLRLWFDMVQNNHQDSSSSSSSNNNNVNNNNVNNNNDVDGDAAIPTYVASSSSSLDAVVTAIQKTASTTKVS